MDFIEFIENKKTLLAQYSFQCEEFLGKNDYLRSTKMTPHYRFTYEFPKPSLRLLLNFRMFKTSQMFFGFITIAF